MRRSRTKQERNEKTAVPSGAAKSASTNIAENSAPICGATDPGGIPDGGVLPRQPGSPAADWEGEPPEDQTDG